MKQSIKIFLSLLVLCLFVHLQSIAQNYSSVKVDELSDAQILQMIKKAESVGYNDTQLEQMAAAQGMKAEEIQKLRARVAKVRKQGSAVQVEQKPVVTGRELSETTAGGEINNEKKEEDSEIGPKIFGSELFRNGNITFEPNLRMATPKGYVIGPDDKLIIDLTGDNEASYNLEVSPDGIINLQYVGRIAVGGLSIDQATAKIRAAMSKTYPSLSSGRTNLAINLGNIRSIKVIMTGYVTKPGTYTLPSLATVYNALYASGGPAKTDHFVKSRLSGTIRSLLL